jgi:DNA-binding MurR/RpiR family transcriptional regulator
MIRPSVDLVEDHSVGRDLANAAPGDAAVIFDFARYRRRSVQAATILCDLGVEIVAITDGPLSPLAALTDTWCELRVPAIGPFDSSVPAVAMAELLVAHVATRLHEEAKERIDRTEEIWAATETFLP